MGDYYRDIKQDTRRLDYGTYVSFPKYKVPNIDPRILCLSCFLVDCQTKHLPGFMQWMLDTQLGGWPTSALFPVV